MTDERDGDRHEFSAGQGVDADYEEFTLDPEEIDADPNTVDPVDSRVLTDILDRRNVESDAIDVERLIDVGLSYMGINRFEEATETFERAAHFAEEDSLEAQEAWVNKGAAHAELEEYDEAIGAYEEALRIDDDSEHAATAETNLAYALWEFGRTEQALEHAERAVETDPRFAEAWYNRGFLLVERGLAEDAVTCFDNAIRLGYRSAGVLEEKARALEEAGEHEQAEEVADRADEIRREAEEQMVEEQTGQAPGPGGRGGQGGRGGAGGPGGQAGGRGGRGGRGGQPGERGESADAPERELQGEGPEGF
ncbi:tetratricopeptide repeat protein [Halorubrum depositum]|uniref:tetratricopeptide repeat protein n=1 Tax=Halorubrum depositum TaxID=2583992 RepID=UPI0011A0B028|nr:tetratricopeptide repeat protein [Halorubrum depositum]